MLEVVSLLAASIGSAVASVVVVAGDAAPVLYMKQAPKTTQPNASACTHAWISSTASMTISWKVVFFYTDFSRVNVSHLSLSKFAQLRRVLLKLGIFLATILFVFCLASRVVRQIIVRHFFMYI